MTLDTMARIMADKAHGTELRAAEGDLGPPAFVSAAAVPHTSRNSVPERTLPSRPQDDPAFLAWAELRALAGKPLLKRLLWSTIAKPSGGP